MDVAVRQQAIGDAAVGVVPTGASFPNNSINNNELSPLLAKVEHPAYQHGQNNGWKRVEEGGSPVGVTSLQWFALFFVFALAVWVIILPDMALSLG